MTNSTNMDGYLPELVDPAPPSDIIPYRGTLKARIKSELPEFKKESVSESDSFHRAFSSVIVTAQFFGVMPVSGITGPNASFIRFKWLSLRTIYTAIALLGIAFFTSLCLVRFWNYNTFQETQCSVFYGCSFFRMLCFLLLARHWPDLASSWEKVETALAHYGYPRHQHRKLRLITGAFLSVAFFEHAMSHVRVIRLAVLCAIEDKMDGICTFFFNSFPHVYDYFSCSLWNGIIMLVLNLLCVFGWTYMDLFIILMSVALADRFRQINKCLLAVQGKPVSPGFWHQIREDYNALASLAKMIDSCISKIVFLSFGNNLYAVCMQLLNSLHPPENAVQMVYFCFSFGYLLLRILAVSLCAASINDQSSQPKNILYSVPATSFSIEVQRFLHQVTTDKIVLTGLNFFSVTRTLLLTVAGSIVTYELILVQFSGIHSADDRDSVTHSVTKRYCL